jgi:hypothetical protein
MVERRKFDTPFQNMPSRNRPRRRSISQCALTWRRKYSLDNQWRSISTFGNCCGPCRHYTPSNASLQTLIVPTKHAPPRTTAEATSRSTPIAVLPTSSSMTATGCLACFPGQMRTQRPWLWRYFTSRSIATIGRPALTRTPVTKGTTDGTAGGREESVGSWRCKRSR